MKIFKRFVLFFTGVIFISSIACKKYPEGPVLSLYTKEHRVVGKWSVEYFAINGYDSTAYLQSQLLFGTYNFSKEKEGRGEFVYNSNGNTGSDPSHYYSAGGYWNFVDHKKSIQIVSSSSHPGRHFNIGAFAADQTLWEIQKLTEKKLWLKCIYNGQEYFVKFTQ
jgi:hypothetical protein